LEFLEKELFTLRVRELDKSSWDMAKSTLMKNADSEALKKQAQILLEEAVNIQTTLNSQPDSWRKEYGRTLSEIFLDCRYVLGKKDKLSFRFGRMIKSLKKSTTGH